MRRSTRGLIVLAFALATFITLRFTLGPCWHGHGPCHQSCAMHAEADASAN